MFHTSTKNCLHMYVFSSHTSGNWLKSNNCKRLFLWGNIVVELITIKVNNEQRTLKKLSRFKKSITLRTSSPIWMSYSSKLLYRSCHHASKKILSFWQVLFLTYYHEKNKVNQKVSHFKCDLCSLFNLNTPLDWLNSSLDSFKVKGKRLLL